MRSDIELVQDVKLGDKKAFAVLVHRHQRSLLRLSLRFTRELSLAEDVVQESFVKAFQKIQLFEERSSFKSWLFQIAVNTARNRLRDRLRDMSTIDNIQVGIEAGAERSLLSRSLNEEIRQEVELLPERQRTALILRVYEDLSFKEIAQIMNCPYDTAKANYRHGLLKLKERFEKENAMEYWRELEQGVAVKVREVLAEVEA